MTRDAKSESPGGWSRRELLPTAALLGAASFRLNAEPTAARHVTAPDVASAFKADDIGYTG